MIGDTWGEGCPVSVDQFGPHRVNLVVHPAKMDELKGTWYPNHTEERCHCGAVKGDRT